MMTTFLKYLQRQKVKGVALQKWSHSTHEHMFQQQCHSLYVLSNITRSRLDIIPIHILITTNNSEHYLIMSSVRSHWHAENQNAYTALSRIDIWVNM